MSLQDEFNALVGTIIKDPERVTCDMDYEAEKICDLAYRNGKMIRFLKDTTPDQMAPINTNIVYANITKNDAGPGWKVTGFQIS